MSTSTFRVSYMMNGRSQYSGEFYTESKAREALKCFKAQGRAWLQTKDSNGNWQTMDDRK